MLRSAAFISVQVLNEYANVALRKRKLGWPMISAQLAALRDALILAVALGGGAEVFYSEDMQHGLVIDGRLRIVDPFR